jgi:hypothetical protein
LRVGGCERVPEMPLPWVGMALNEDDPLGHGVTQPISSNHGTSCRDSSMVAASSRVVRVRETVSKSEIVDGLSGGYERGGRFRLAAANFPLTRSSKGARPRTRDLR